jgi:hypothetical protein
VFSGSIERCLSIVEQIVLPLAQPTAGADRVAQLQVPI